MDPVPNDPGECHALHLFLATQVEDVEAIAVGSSHKPFFFRMPGQGIHGRRQPGEHLSLIRMMHIPEDHQPVGARRKKLMRLRTLTKGINTIAVAGKLGEFWGIQGIQMKVQRWR